MPRKDELRDTPCSPMRMANFPECQVWASRNDCVQFFVFLKLGLGLWLQTILLTKKLSCRTEKADVKRAAPGEPRVGCRSPPLFLHRSSWNTCEISCLGDMQLGEGGSQEMVVCVHVRTCVQLQFPDPGRRSWDPQQDREHSLFPAVCCPSANPSQIHICPGGNK